MATGHHDSETTSGLGDQTWTDVLAAMDRTYAELVDYQEQLEARNAELTTLRNFLASIMVSITDYLVVADREGHIADASASFCAVPGLEVALLSGRSLRDFVAEEDRDRLMRGIADAISLRQDVTLSVDLLARETREPVE